MFRISPSGTYTNLYSFGSQPNDGAGPWAGLVQGSDGNFYGTTYNTTTNDAGTVFRITPSGTETTLYMFGNSPNDGANPRAGLIQGSDGNFYGTTYVGGQHSYYNPGTVFRISPSGTYTSLYSFGSSPYGEYDGAYPSAALVQGSDGNFYGTTQVGGTTNFRTACYCYGYGTVFRISPSGSETILYSFAGSPTDGSSPVAGLVQGSDGNFYGTTYEGGMSGSGTVFRITPSGSYTNLYKVVGPPDGDAPQAGLVQGSDGNFYGATELGGTNTSCFGGAGCGTAFKLAVSLNPPPYPIDQITSAHLAATNIIFTVSSIAGETYQLQFSSSMNPTNWVNVSGASVTNSIGALLTLTNFAGALLPQGFYRFAITP